MLALAKGMALVGGMLLALAVCQVPAARAQAPKVFKVGILTTAWAPWHTFTLGFRDALKEFGYVEGQNVTFEVRTSQGDRSRLPELAAELAKAKPDLLYCVDGPDACQKATQTIPIVFSQVSDPVKLGLVKSLARPGGNVTGIGSLRAELTAKRLQLFKEAVPALRRVGAKLFINPGSLGQPRYGVPDATYAVWDDGQVQIKHLHYDHDATAQRLRLEQLDPEVTEQLTGILETGIIT